MAAIHFLCMRLRETNRGRRPSRCIASRCGSPDCCCRRCACNRREPRAADFPSSLALELGPRAWPSSLALEFGKSLGELALLIGASRPKVNIALATLEDMGGIERAGARLLCNTEVLESVAEME